MSAKKREIRVKGDLAFVPLTKGYEAVIDSCDVNKVSGHNWYARVEKNTVYGATNIVTPSGKRKTLFLQRAILSVDEGMTVDHKDRDGLNNRRSNLRACSWASNQWNSKAQSGSTSGYKGVNWHKGRSKWQARIRVNGKRHLLGYFDDPDLAHAAYCKAGAQLHGEYFNPGDQP